MAWSTRELARMAGTTVNTIRHYHRLGLLELPEREDNGYKQYQVRHLVCLLRIRRMAELGVPLARIATVTAGNDPVPEELARIDADLAAQIDRLQQARDDIAAILRAGAPADAPAGFEEVAARMSEADRSMMHIYQQLYDDDAIADLRSMVEADTDAVGAEVDALPADADEETRQRLAERLAPIIARDMVTYPWMQDPGARLSKRPNVTEETFLEALVELYNPAQLDVMGRASILARKQLDDADAATG